MSEYKSMYVAKIVKTGQLLFSSNLNDLERNEFMWYNMDDGNSIDCFAVMDNKTFFRKLNSGEIEFVKK